MKGQSKPAHDSSRFSHYLDQINETPLLSHAEEKTLGARILTGDLLARDHLIRANLRLVVCLARRFTGRGLPLEDLVADGNLGLLHAAEGYDPSIGTRFSTYASYWIKQSIRAALVKTGKFVRLPAYMHTVLNKWRRAAETLRAELGREPTVEEVSASLKLSRRKFAMALHGLEAAALIPIEEGYEHHGEETVLSRQTDHRMSAHDEAEFNEIYGTVQSKAAEVLGDRELSILYGRANGRKLSNLGDEHGLTRERVRQISVSSAAKIRSAMEHSR